MPNKRTTRLQLMFDDEELAALDDWRFAMRMPSRAAAMRALMRFGLKLNVDPEDFGIDPATMASSEIGLVSGADFHPAISDNRNAAIRLDDRAEALASELARLRNQSPAEAVTSACEMALNALRTGAGPTNATAVLDKD